MALLILGGGLKRHEMISARFGDVLSELYLLSAVLKRWHDEGRQADDLPLVAWCMAAGCATIDARLDEILANFPSRPAAWLMRFLLLPPWTRRRGPSDALTQACAAILTEPCAARDRLTVDLFHSTDDGGVARLDRAFALIAAVQPLRDRLRQAHVRDLAVARQRGLINEAEADQLAAVQRAVADVIAVDDFAPEDISPRRAARPQGDVSSPAATPIQSSAAE
jgi:acyl-CoA dehydrogenase